MSVPPNAPARPTPVLLAGPMTLPMALDAVACGFPSPAQDYPHDELDLTAKLVRDPASTYVWRAAGHSMTGAGIRDQDLLLVDRGITAVAGHNVIAIVDGEFSVKRYARFRGRPVLRAENPDYADITPTEFSEITIWGVVTWILHPELEGGPLSVRRAV